VRHLVGVDNMPWSTVFPHHGNDWPYSRRTIESLFVGVPDDERQKIVCENAARFWRL
jgi:predicted TIM-barrel fold metal-dependent hydrolase